MNGMRIATLLRIGAAALYTYNVVKAVRAHSKGETVDAIYYLVWSAIMYMASNL